MRQTSAEQRVVIQRQLAERASAQPQIRQLQRQLRASNNSQPCDSPNLGIVNGRPSQSPVKTSGTQQNTPLDVSRTPSSSSAATQSDLIYNSPPVLATAAYSGNQGPGVTQIFNASVGPTPTLGPSYGGNILSASAYRDQRGYSSCSINPTYTNLSNDIVASSPQTRVEAQPDSMVDNTRAAADTGSSGRASTTEMQDWACQQCAGINNGRLATWRCLKCGSVQKSKA